jgi:hypothetical protein
VGLLLNKARLLCGYHYCNCGNRMGRRLEGGKVLDRWKSGGGSIRRASSCRLSIVPNGKRLLRVDKGHTCMLRDGHVVKRPERSCGDALYVKRLGRVHARPPGGGTVCKGIGQSPQDTRALVGRHCMYND